MFVYHKKTKKTLKHKCELKLRELNHPVITEL